MTRLAALLSLLAFPVAAGDTATWAEWGETYNPSTVTIRATTEPGAVAEIVFRNEDVNGPSDNDTFAPVVLGDLTVEITFIWQARPDGSDAIIARPPPGYIAIPDTLVVPEGGTETLLIYPEIALGM